VYKGHDAKAYHGDDAMKKKTTWTDPSKQQPKSETMNTPGDFKVFTDLMRKVIEKPKTASRVPASS
jgi:hypothetical protein